MSASAKVRGGTSHDDKVDLKNDEVRERTWIGVVPAWIQYGEPIASPENRVRNVSSLLRKDRFQMENRSLILATRCLHIWKIT